MMMGPRSLVATLVVLVLLAAGFFAAYVNATLDERLSLAADGQVILVESGSSLAGVSNRLAASGALKHPAFLNWYGRIQGTATQIKAGEYFLDAATTPRSLLQQLVAGEIYLHQLTILEGWQAQQMLAAVREHPAISRTEFTLEQIMAELGSPDLHPEGQFFPDTYRFARGTTDVALLRQSHDALAARLAATWQQRQHGYCAERPLRSVDTGVHRGKRDRAGQ